METYEDRVKKLNDALLELKARKIQTLEAIKQFRKENGIEFFEPHPKQVPAFAAVTDPAKKVIVYQGGNRSGKTSWLITSLLSLCLGEFPWNHTKLRFKPPIRARLLGEDQGHHVKEVLIPKLREYCPKGELEKGFPRKNNQGVDSYWQFKNGSTIEIMSYEQDTDLFESWSGHVAAFDEPPPRDKYVATKRGLVDFNGLALMSFTPLKEPWLYDEIVMSSDPAIACFYSTIRDNPHINAAAITEFEKSLTDDEKEARIKGGWLFLQGLVYKEFEKETHIVQPFTIPNEWTVYAAVDTHPRTPQAVMFLAVDPKERMFVIHDIFQQGTPADVAEWIINFHKKQHEVDLVLIDPSSQGDQNRGDTTYEIIEKALSQNKIYLEPGSKDLGGGILQVKQALKSPGSGMPSLFVTSNCERTIWEFGRYIWDEYRDSQLRTEKQKPRDKDDHQMENLRRLVQHPVTFRRKGFLQNLVEQANMGYQPSDPVSGY